MKIENPEMVKEDSIVSSPRSTVYLRVGKRLLDLFLAGVGLIVSSPLLFVCAVAVRLDSPGPIFFRQDRIGQHGEGFEIIKLRTMVNGAEREGVKLTAANDPRITVVGQWLRKTKVDEIPQLLNVLRGEMSLVGPRPETPEHVACYNQIQRRVLEFKPGLTGPASVAFIDEEKILANQLDVEQYYVKTLLPIKLNSDLTYCETVSLVGDLQLILLTVKKLLTRVSQHN